MKQLESKFPLNQQVEWTKYLEGLPLDRQVNTFPEFLKWLDTEGNVWSAMESKGMSVAARNTKPSATMYSNDGSTP